MEQKQENLISTLEVAKLVGKSKQTILRLVQKGDISAIRQKDKSFLFDLSEVARVFPRVDLDNIEKARQNEAPHDGAKNKNGSQRSILEMEREIFEIKLAFEVERREKAEKLVLELKKQIEDLNEKNYKLMEEVLNINKRFLEPPKRKKFFGLL